MPALTEYACKRVYAFSFICLFVASGCSQQASDQKSDASTSETAASTDIVPSPSPAPPQKESNALEQKAILALHDNRIYAPAGNNAIEYYLLMRQAQPNDPEIADALDELMPYAVLAADRSMQSGDLKEANRLLTMIEKFDRNSPALPRLRKALELRTKMVAQASAATPSSSSDTSPVNPTVGENAPKEKEEAVKKESQAKALELIAAHEARKAALRLAEHKKMPTEKNENEDSGGEKNAVAADGRSAVSAESTQAQPMEPKPKQSSPDVDLKPIETPAPVYPEDALSEGITGEVTVQFTVQTDGKVKDVEVLHSSPRSVFDRAAIRAVSHWRFAPLLAPVTTQRTIAFKTDR